MTENLRYLCDDGRHLICLPYSVVNLHQMAEDLNIKRCWFHKSRLPHYDIPQRRITEIQSKCEIVSTTEIVLLIGDAIIEGDVYDGSYKSN